MQNLALFLCGVRDSASAAWINQVLFFKHPLTKQIHPESTKLARAIGRLLVQILFVYVLAPIVLQWLASNSWLFTLLYYYALLLVTILTYGYTFFYFGDVFKSAGTVIRWHKRICSENKLTFPYAELDSKEKSGIFTDLSNKIKSVVFLISYVAIFVMCSKILILIPYIGTFCLVASQSFFNGAFYFLRKWPYDQFNLAFLEKQWAYLTGYGLIVSIVCNVVFVNSVILSNGAYFLLSIWLVINCIGSTPPELPQLDSPSDVIRIVKRPSNQLPNSYNVFRAKLEDPNFQKQVRMWPRALKFVIGLTNKINETLEKIYNNISSSTS